MSTRRSRRIRLHERRRQWELELIPEVDYDELTRGFLSFRNGVFKAVSAIVKTTGLQLEALAALANLKTRPTPDAWSVLGARDRLLSPWLHHLAFAVPVEINTLSPSGDSSCQPYLKVSGLSSSVLTQDSSLIYVFLPMSSFFLLPASAYTLSDMTSKIFVPAEDEEQEPALRNRANLREKERRDSERRMTIVAEREQTIDEQEAMLAQREQAVQELKAYTDERQVFLDDVENQQKMVEEQQEQRQKALDETESQQKSKEEQLAEKEAMMDTRDEQQRDHAAQLERMQRDQDDMAEKQRTTQEILDERTADLDGREKQQNARQEEQDAMEENLNEHRRLLNEKEQELSERQKALDEIEEQQSETARQQEEKQERLEEGNRILEENQERLEERNNALDDIEQLQNDREEEQNKKEKELTEQQTVLEEKQAENQQFAEKLKQRQEALLEELEQMKERELEVEQEEQRLRKLDEGIREKEAILNEKETTLDALQSKLISEEDRLNDREISLDALEESVKEREANVVEKETELTDRETILSEQEQAQAKKQEELETLEGALAEKEQSLNELGERLEEMQKRLEEEEELLKGRDNVLRELEEKQRDWEAKNREEEDRLILRARELDETEERHKEWEIKSREEQEMLAERQKALEELEEMLKDWERRSQEEEEKLKEEEAKIKAEEEKLQEREKLIEQEEESQRERKQKLEEEDARQKEVEEKLKEEEANMKAEEEKLQEREKHIEQEEESQRDRKQKLEEEEARQKEVEDRLSKREEEQKAMEETLQEKERLAREKDQQLAEWEERAANARFQFGSMDEAGKRVDRGVGSDTVQPSGRGRRARSLPPNTGGTGSEVVSVLTEDDVVMVSSFKGKGQKSTIVETYDIKYMREEIFDSAQESVSTHGITRPGRGIQHSHESESFMLAAAETGRGSASSRSSSRSSQRSAASVHSHISVETQTTEVMCSPDRQQLSDEAGGERRRRSLSKDSGGTDATEENVRGSLGEETSPQISHKRIVNFCEDSATVAPLQDSENHSMESDRSHSKSPTLVSERNSPPIVFTLESHGTDSSTVSMIVKDNRKACSLSSSTQKEKEKDKETMPRTTKDVKADSRGRNILREVSQELANEHAEPSVSPKVLECSHVTSQRAAVSLVQSVKEQGKAMGENEDFGDVHVTSREAECANDDHSKEKKTTEGLIVTRRENRNHITSGRHSRADDGYSLERTDMTSSSEDSLYGDESTEDISFMIQHQTEKDVTSKKRRGDDGYSLERTDPTSSSEESSDELESFQDISIDCISPEIARMLPTILARTEEHQVFEEGIDERACKYSRDNSPIQGALQSAAVTDQSQLTAEESGTFIKTMSDDKLEPSAEYYCAPVADSELSAIKSEAMEVHDNVSLDGWSVLSIPAEGDSGNASEDHDDQVTAHQQDSIGAQRLHSCPETLPFASMPQGKSDDTKKHETNVRQSKVSSAESSVSRKSAQCLSPEGKQILLTHELQSASQSPSPKICDTSTPSDLSPLSYEILQKSPSTSPGRGVQDCSISPLISPEANQDEENEESVSVLQMLPLSKMPSPKPLSGGEPRSSETETSPPARKSSGLLQLKVTEHSPNSTEALTGVISPRESGKTVLTLRSPTERSDISVQSGPLGSPGEKSFLSPRSSVASTSQPTSISPSALESKVNMQSLDSTKASAETLSSPEPVKSLSLSKSSTASPKISTFNGPFSASPELLQTESPSSSCTKSASPSPNQTQISMSTQYEGPQNLESKLTTPPSLQQSPFGSTEKHSTLSYPSPTKSKSPSPTAWSQSRRVPTLDLRSPLKEEDSYPLSANADQKIPHREQPRSGSPTDMRLSKSLALAVSLSSTALQTESDSQPSSILNSLRKKTSPASESSSPQRDESPSQMLSPYQAHSTSPGSQAVPQRMLKSPQMLPSSLQRERDKKPSATFSSTPAQPKAAKSPAISSRMSPMTVKSPYSPVMKPEMMTQESIQQSEITSPSNRSLQESKIPVKSSSPALSTVSSRHSSSSPGKGMKSSKKFSPVQTKVETKRSPALFQVISKFQQMSPVALQSPRSPLIKSSVLTQDCLHSSEMTSPSTQSSLKSYSSVNSTSPPMLPTKPQHLSSATRPSEHPSPSPVTSCLVSAEKLSDHSSAEARSSDCAPHRRSTSKLPMAISHKSPQVSQQHSSHTDTTPPKGSDCDNCQQPGVEERHQAFGGEKGAAAQESITSPTCSRLQSLVAHFQKQVDESKRHQMHEGSPLKKQQGPSKPRNARSEQRHESPKAVAGARRSSAIPHLTSSHDPYQRQTVQSKEEIPIPEQSRTTPESGKLSHKYTRKQSPQAKQTAAITSSKRSSTSPNSCRQQGQQNALPASAAVHPSTKQLSPSCVTSRSSVASHSSSAQGRSPPFKRLSPAPLFSPGQDSSLHHLLASQRKRGASPRPAPENNSSKVSRKTSAQRDSPKHSSLPPCRVQMSHIKTDSTGPSLSEALASLDVPSTPSATSSSQPSQPSSFVNGQPKLAETSHSSKVPSVDNHPVQKACGNMSPGRCLVSTVLQTNGAAGLKSMLARQRKASQEKENTKLKATKADQNATRGKILHTPEATDSQSSQSVSKEHVITSVCQKQVERKGKEPSSIITVTKKRVRYTREPVGTKQTRSPKLPSPSTIHHTPEQSDTAIRLQAALAPHGATAKGNTERSLVPMLRYQTSPPESGFTRGQGKDAVIIDRMYGADINTTAVYGNHRSHSSVEATPQSDEQKYESHVKQNSQLHTHGMSHTARNSELRNNTSSHQHASNVGSPRPATAAEHLHTDTNWRTQTQHAPLSQSPRFNQNEPQRISTQSSGQAHPSVQSKCEADQMQPQLFRGIAAYSGKLPMSQMEEREMLLRRHLLSKKHYMDTAASLRACTRNAGDSEDSDFSDFFREYQSERPPKNVSPEKKDLLRTSFGPRSDIENVLPSERRKMSPRKHQPPTPTSPPVKRRALDADAATAVKTDEPWRERFTPIDTCNSSPVRRPKGYESNRFRAYPSSSPPRTSPGVLRDRNEILMHLGQSSNRSTSPLSLGAAHGSRQAEIAFGQQLHSYRHQQGVIGDSSETVQDILHTGRSEVALFDQHSQLFSSDNRRCKLGRRVSWNDSQSGSAAANKSGNHNPNLCSDENTAEEKEMVKQTKSTFDRDGNTVGFADRQMQDMEPHGVSQRKLKSDYEGRIETTPQHSQRDSSTFPEEISFSAQRQHSSSSKKHRLQPATDMYKDTNVSSNVTNCIISSEDGGTGDKSTPVTPASVHFSREQMQTTEFRKNRNDTAFSKEDIMQRKEFSSKTDAKSTSVTQKHCLRKRYTMQNQHKCTVVTEERQHMEEYIFKNSPHADGICAQMEHDANKQFEMKYNNPKDRDNVRPCEAETETNGHWYHTMDSNSNFSEQEENVLKDPSSSVACRNSLSLHEELRLAGLSGEHKQLSPVQTYRLEVGDSVDKGESKNVKLLMDTTADPYPYLYSRSHICDLNESANSSSVAEYGENHSPDVNACDVDCTFFTPQLADESAGEAGGTADDDLPRQNPDLDPLTFESVECRCGLTQTTGQQADDRNRKAVCAECSDHNESCPRCDCPCCSQCLSVHCKEASTSDYSTPFDEKAHLQGRHQRQEQSGDDRNNSGDDHSKSTPHKYTQRLTKQDHLPHGKGIETTTRGGGDQVDSSIAKGADGKPDHAWKVLGDSQHPALTGSSLRWRRSFGKGYRPNAVQQYSVTDSQDSSGNCAHIQAFAADEECQCDYWCCQKQDRSHWVQHVPVACQSMGECQCAVCEYEQAEYCPCTSNANCCVYVDCDLNECSCIENYMSALNIADGRYIPRAVTCQCNSVTHTNNCCSSECNRSDVARHGVPDSREREQNGEDQSSQVSVPSAYSDDCQCAVRYRPGRGDGDVSPRTWIKQNYNMSRCHQEQHKRRVLHQHKPSQEAQTEHVKEHPAGETSCKGSSEDTRESQLTDLLHDHHDLCDGRSHPPKEKPPSYITNDDPSASHKGCQLSMTESMVQAYGYNPLTESPFTACGYPSLCTDSSTLDHITVPFVKRKALVFLRNDKEEFVEVGRGTYGCVYLAQATTRRGTAKVVVKDFFTDSTSWDLIVHEARMLCYLQDTGVIPHFYGLLKRRTAGDDFSLIQQFFAQGTTLHTALVNKQQMEADVWQDVAWQLARGLLLIHEHHVLLNDLKGDNVLIDLRRERKTIKYIDLGMATYRKGLNFHLPQDQMSKFNFLSPEVRAGAYTSPLSDVYSLGYLLDQINRLAHLQVLKDVSDRCMDELPVDRPHLADVVDVLQPSSASGAGACSSD